ncbi:MAG: RsiV family protein [Pilosibacter sp.]
MIWAVRIRPPTTIITVFDTQTGKQLELSDMVKDMDGFRSYVKEELAGRAADRELFDGYEDTVDTLFDGTNADSSLEWAITENGVSVYFAPYEDPDRMRRARSRIAVPFKDHELMFGEAYMGASTDGWAKKWIRGIP